MPTFSRSRCVWRSDCVEELRPGDRVLLLLPPGLEFVQVFLACLHARVIAVPAPAPAPEFAGFAAARQRIEAIVSDATPALIVCSPEFASTAGKQLAPTIRSLTPSSLLASEDPGYSDEAVAPDTIAFLQYTSGSTATPKGVMVSHANVIANHRVILRSLVGLRLGLGMSWLPMFHDMGLIGNILFSLGSGQHCIFMSPTHFVQRPIRWLRAISKYRASWSGGPNFAFDMCVKKTRPEDRADLDLSCWDYAFMGAEPIRVTTLRRFCETFEPYGFSSARGPASVLRSRRRHSHGDVRPWTAPC